MLEILLEKQGLVSRRILDDPICALLSVLNSIAYIGWAAIFIAVYPLQSSDSRATIAIVASSITLLLIIFYLDRIYKHRLYQIKVKLSRARFKYEMRQIENELN